MSKIVNANSLSSIELGDYIRVFKRHPYSSIFADRIEDQHIATGRVTSIVDTVDNVPRRGFFRVTSYLDKGAETLISTSMAAASFSVLEKLPGTIETGTIWQPYFVESLTKFIKWLPYGATFVLNNEKDSPYVKMSGEILLSPSKTESVSQLITKLGRVDGTLPSLTIGNMPQTYYTGENSLLELFFGAK